MALFHFQMQRHVINIIVEKLESASVCIPLISSVGEGLEMNMKNEVFFLSHG